MTWVNGSRGNGSRGITNKSLRSPLFKSILTMFKPMLLCGSSKFLAVFSSSSSDALWTAFWWRSKFLFAPKFFWHVVQGRFCSVHLPLVIFEVVPVVCRILAFLTGKLIFFDIIFFVRSLMLNQPWFGLEGFVAIFAFPLFSRGTVPMNSSVFHKNTFFKKKQGHTLTCPSGAYITQIQKLFSFGQV